MFKWLRKWACGAAAAFTEQQCASEEVRAVPKCSSSRLRNRFEQLQGQGWAEPAADMKVSRKRSVRARLWEVFPQLEADPNTAACEAEGRASKAEPEQASRQPSLSAPAAPATPPAPQKQAAVHAPVRISVSAGGMVSAALPEPAAVAASQQPASSSWVAGPCEEIAAGGAEGADGQTPSLKPTSTTEASAWCLWVAEEEFEQRAAAMAAEAELAAEEYTGPAHRTRDCARLPRKWRSGPDLGCVAAIF